MFSDDVDMELCCLIVGKAVTLLLVPVREVAFQIAQQFEALGAGIRLKTAVLVGGVSKNAQQLALAKWPQIIVATPGRLLDHLHNTKGFSLPTLKYMVLDEADRLQELYEECLEGILKVIPRKRRTYLFSATMTDKVMKLQNASLRNPVKIGVDEKYSTVESLKQQYLSTPATYKDCYLLYVLTELSGNAIVFTRPCTTSQLVALMLNNLNYRAISMNGKMTQAKRLEALKKFYDGECNILVATDIAIRGLDIRSVDMVINYDIPFNSKDYIYRVGRTARAGKSGVAISLVNEYETESFFQIEYLIGKKLLKYPAEEEDALALLGSVTSAKRIALAEFEESGGKKRRRNADEVVSTRDDLLRSSIRDICL